MSEAIPFETSKNAGTSRVFIREARAGTWIVHDESDRKGGCFTSRHAAFRFVEDEFGLSAEIVVQPNLSAMIARLMAMPKPLQSIAQRAVAAYGAATVGA